MIISRLNGGLGNQMFQYSLGRVLSKLNSTSLYLDLSLYSKNKNYSNSRDYELDIFENIKAEIYTNQLQKESLKINRLKLILNKYLKLKLSAYPSNWIKEESSQFNPKILKLRGSYLLDGYWQTEKYFKKYRDTILNDFVFPKKTSKKNQELIKKIKCNQATSIHVRRGDYVSNIMTNKYHGVLPLKYYKKAIDLIRTKVSKPIFIIFSDDLNWCRNNLAVPKNSIFVSNNKKNSFEDMRLMSLCKHNIIANSSFSWWGAWLNKNKSKIVIAPSPWFKNKNTEHKDIVPADWIKIKS